ncbi:MAG TPA: hypothetical protein VM509_15585 [Planctomycetota bacterium]|nr:hypothetical protein [Planctomycetota bacterium]
MKRLLFAAITLGTALVLGSNASAPAPASSFSYNHGTPAATDDPVPVDCPFCGGDATLHVRRMNAIAVETSHIAYRVLDASLF